MRKSIAGLFLALSGLMASSAPQAAWLDCAANNGLGIVDNVTLTDGTTVATVSTATSSGCAYNDTRVNDVVTGNGPIVNRFEQGIFGFNDWVQAASYGGTNWVGDSGTWDIASLVQSTWKQAMLIFKGGNGTTIVGYHINLAGNYTSGNWTTPFVNPPFVDMNASSGQQATSHISVYFSETSNTPPCPVEPCNPPVPEPSGMGLLAVAGGVVAFSARRRRRCV